MSSLARGLGRKEESASCQGKRVIVTRDESPGFIVRLRTQAILPHVPLDAESQSTPSSCEAGC